MTKRTHPPSLEWVTKEDVMNNAVACSRLASPGRSCGSDPYAFTFRVEGQPPKRLSGENWIVSVPPGTDFSLTFPTREKGLSWEASPSGSEEVKVSAAPQQEGQSAFKVEVGEPEGLTELVFHLGDAAEPKAQRIVTVMAEEGEVGTYPNSEQVAFERDGHCRPTKKKTPGVTRGWSNQCSSH